MLRTPTEDCIRIYGNVYCSNLKRIQMPTITFGIRSIRQQITYSLWNYNQGSVQCLDLCVSDPESGVDIPSLGRNPFPLSSVGITRQHLWSRIHHLICSAVVLRFLGKKRLENQAVDSVKQRIWGNCCLIWWKTEQRGRWLAECRRENCPEFEKNFMFVLEISNFSEMWGRRYDGG